MLNGVLWLLLHLPNCNTLSYQLLGVRHNLIRDQYFHLLKITNFTNHSNANREKVLWKLLKRTLCKLTENSYSSKSP